MLKKLEWDGTFYSLFKMMKPYQSNKNQNTPKKGTKMEGPKSKKTKKTT
jgi:hypothetical protein